MCSFLDSVRTDFSDDRREQALFLFDLETPRSEGSCLIQSADRGMTIPEQFLPRPIPPTTAHSLSQLLSLLETPFGGQDC
jgi:hypothetical protein